MKKQKLKQFRDLANSMPLDISIDKNGFPHANCRYRQMKKIYRIKGEDAVVDYCKSVMDNLDKINADNAEINKIIAERLALAKESNDNYIRKTDSVIGSIVKKTWKWVTKIFK